jgi:arginyl-tRNA synthetase
VHSQSTETSRNSPKPACSPQLALCENTPRNDREKADIKAKREAGDDVASLEAQSLDEQARAYFKKMVDGDPAALSQWKRFRSASVEKFNGAKPIVAMFTMGAYKKLG